MQVQAPVKTPDIQLAPTDPEKKDASAKGKKFKLLLFNDNMNKCALRAARRFHLSRSAAQTLMAYFDSSWHRREYVAKILQATVPGLTAADAYLIMQKAHQNGMAVVGVWVFELAEVRTRRAAYPHKHNPRTRLCLALLACTTVSKAAWQRAHGPSKALASKASPGNALK